MVRATHKADDLLAAGGRPHAKDPQTQQNVLEAIHNVCQTPAISIKQNGYRKRGRQAKRWEDHINSYLQPNQVHGDNNDLTNDMDSLTTAQDGLKWDSMESDFVRIRLKQSKKNDHDRHDDANQTNINRTSNTHERSPRRRRRHLPIFSQIIES